MASKFLDSPGITHLWEQIKALIGILTDGTAASESGTTIDIGEYDLMKIREIKGNSQVYENTVVGNTVENLDVYDNNDTKKGSLPLNLTELIGKANGEGTSVTIYPNGLHGVGTVYDSLIVDEDGYARRAIKRRDRVDLGSLSWSSARTGTSGKLRFSAALTGATSSALSNYLCTGYSTVTVDYTYLCVTGIAVANNLIYVYDSNKDTGYGNQFKAYVAGVYLDYELATPIEYVLDTPVQCVTKVYPNGTVKQVPVMPDSTPMVMDVTYLHDTGGVIGGLIGNYATTAFVQSAIPKDYQVDYSKTYLTFEALESGTFTFTGYSTNTVSYSTDDGKTWTSLASATASPTISAGDRIMWKASGLSIDSSESGIGTFSATGNFNIEGNAMSLASGDDFIGKTTISAYQFRTLFKNNTKLISAENLILPATTASIGCYREMFYGCTGLTTPPELPATTLSNNCYDAMFYDCTSLKTAPKLYVATLANNSYRKLFYGCTLINYIECLAIDISASNCTQYITRDVASTGTFVIADGMTSWQRNYHGIPSNWTVRTKSEMEYVTKGELDDVVGNIETLLAAI